MVYCLITERSIAFDWQFFLWVRLSSIAEPSRAIGFDWVRLPNVRLTTSGNKNRQTLSRLKPWCNDSGVLNLHHGYYTATIASRKLFLLKVAKHSFSARFCWCKLARAQGFQKTNMPLTQRSLYLLNTRTICVIFLYNCMQCIDCFSILLQRYVTKGNDAKNSAFLAFVCCRKNPVKCNACAVARKIETDCFSRNVPFSRDPVVRISRNLAKK